MDSGTAQTMPPVHQLGRAGLSATIIALVVLAILAGIFIYAQIGQQMMPTSSMSSAEIKAQYVARMQEVVQSQPALAPEEKASFISAMATRITN